MLSAVCGSTPVASLPQRSPSFYSRGEGIRTASCLHNMGAISHRPCLSGDFSTPLSRWTVQIYAPHETLMQILYPLLHTQCLQGFQENDFLKPAPRLSKSRLQIFFQLFLVFED